MSDTSQQTSSRLTALAGIPSDIQKDALMADDRVWIEVIQQMDSIYADLVESQVKLEEKNAELKNAHQFIESVISSMSDILIVCDINGKIIQVNKALTEFLQKPLSDLINQPLTILFSDQDQALVAGFPQHIRSGCIIDKDIDLVNSENESVPLAISCSSRFDHKNRLSGFVITGRPLGELKKTYSELHKAHAKLQNAQRHLIQTEKMASLGRLVAGVAHELNNPISFLYANMYAMQSCEQKLKTYLGAIHKKKKQTELDKLRKELNIDHMIDDMSPLIEGSLEGAERVTEIVQNLRKFITPQEAGKQEFDLIETINRAINWVLNAAPVKPRIIKLMPAKMMLINSEGLIQQILINLLQNALDALFEQKNPQIEITVEDDTNNVRIRVKDNGQGIDANDLIKIFDPFYTTKPVGSGTGLGLYISYGLATEQCNGNLSVKSNKLKGACFTLSLPRKS